MVRTASHVSMQDEWIVHVHTRKYLRAFGGFNISSNSKVNCRCRNEGMRKRCYQVNATSEAEAQLDSPGTKVARQYFFLTVPEPHRTIPVFDLTRNS